MLASGSSKFLVDGFPRKLDQLEEFEATVKPCDAVLVFNIPEEDAIARLVERGKTSGRADDNEEAIRARFDAFRQESRPVIDALASSGRVHEFESVASVEEVFAEVQQVMDMLDATATERVTAADLANAQEKATEVAAQPATEEGSELVVPQVAGSLPADLLIVFVLGGPGSGKGTQCDKIKGEYEVVHLSAGDLLREEVASGSGVGAACEALMREGQLVPVSVTLGLLRNAMIRSQGHAFLVDGFPRALDQAEAFERAIGAPASVLFFDCPREEMERRLLHRGLTSGRSDDNAATIIKRFTTFVEQSLPVKTKYEELGKCAVISAVASPDQVYVEVRANLESIHMPHKKGAELVVPQVAGSLPADLLIVFVLGGPGSGKGTQCDKIKGEYEVVHLSAGDLLREEVASGSGVGAACEALMREGQLVPVSVTLGLLRNAMIRSQGHAFLVDGFPRALDQAEAFERAIGAPASVLFFDCPREEMERRLLHRGLTSGRSDDNAATIIKRFTTFVEQSLPVKTKYEELGNGKGTQCDKIKGEYEVVHLSAGDLLREEVASGSAVGAACEAMMREGQLVPVSVTLGLLRNAMIQSQGHAFLVDGFPRALDQAEAFERAIGAPASVLFFDCPREEMERRLLHRGLTSGRSDDNAATIIKRFTTFVEQSLPVKTKYEELGKCAVISAVANPDQVYVKVKEVLERIHTPRKQASASQSASPTRCSLPVHPQQQVEEHVASISTLVVISGPSGVGKGTLISKLLTEYSNRFGFSVSHTTRAPRPGEENGVHYWFSSREEVDSEISKGMFLEHADVHGNVYGTTYAAVADVSRAGKICILDIDVQGASAVRSSAVGSKSKLLFIAPPSTSALEARLRGRGTETEDKIQTRLGNAEAEIQQSRQPGLFDAVITNGESLQDAYVTMLDTLEGLVPGTFTAPELADQHARALALRKPAPAPVTAKKVAGGGGALPVRQYMDQSVVPVLREALRALNEARPEDPLLYLADYLMAARAKSSAHA
ncbi:MAG: hypothetical protein WDW38_002654 [Sanguina aurantia]